MGYDLRVYVGPYLSVEGHKEVEEIKAVRTCSNTECRYHNTSFSGKFCTQCGSEIKTREITTTAKVSPHYLLLNHDDFNDNLSYTDQMLGKSPNFIPNVRAPFDRGRDDLEEGKTADLTEVNVDVEINWFYSEFNREILFLEKELGAKNVRVKWGVVCYYS